jgi:hypothetical protein
MEIAWRIARTFFKSCFPQCAQFRIAVFDARYHLRHPIHGFFQMLGKEPESRSFVQHTPTREAAMAQS